jgi:trehalose 2-sulfotransferase
MINLGSNRFFNEVRFDPALYDEVMARPAARINYVIYFTPRSGSSWLTDVLVQTRRMSLANEAFNPSFIPAIAQAVNASDLDQYINALKRKHNNHGVYGFQVTWHQLNAVFPRHQDFIAHFGTGPAFWLIRRDIVAQAVSLAKMVATRVAHSPHASPEERTAADRAFDYDSSQIKHWMQHILAAERGTEAFFQEHGITPLRMSYEDMMAQGAEAVAVMMMDHVGATPVPGTIIQSKHEKLATARNADYAARFRADCAAFMSGVEQERAAWVDKLGPPSPPG